MTKVGTMDTKPIRVSYSNGDYGKAYDLIASAGLKIVYKTVASVEPYEATIHLEDYVSREKATQALDEAGVAWSEPKPFY